MLVLPRSTDYFFNDCKVLETSSSGINIAEQAILPGGLKDDSGGLACENVKLHDIGLMAEKEVPNEDSDDRTCVNLAGGMCDCAGWFL
jgi:hypothetical protein